MFKSTQEHNSDIIAIHIKSNGGQIRDTVSVSSIVLHLKNNSADEAILTLPCNYEHSANEIEEFPEFFLDKEIEIGLGYGINNNKLFTGRVTENKIIKKDESALKAEITCKETNTIGKPIPKNTKQNEQKEFIYGYDNLEFELCKNKSEQKAISGNFTFQGNPNYNVGMPIKLSGFGKSFSSLNDFIISEVLHEVRDGNWNTTISIGEKI